MKLGREPITVQCFLDIVTLSREWHKSKVSHYLVILISESIILARLVPISDLSVVTQAEKHCTTYGTYL